MMERIPNRVLNMAKIVKEHKGFVIFANTIGEYEEKVDKIDKGQTKGFGKLNDYLKR